MAQFKEDLNWCSNKITEENGEVKYECKKCHKEFKTPIRSHIQKCYTKEERELLLKKWDEDHPKEIDYEKLTIDRGDGTYECKGCHKIFGRNVWIHLQVCEEAVGKDISDKNKKKLRDNLKNSSLKQYGVENRFQAEEIKRKAKKTKYEKYGDETFTNREKCKETTLKHYGKEYYFQTDECKKQNEEACMRIFGTRHNWQADIYNTPKRSRYIYNKIQFDSYPELVYYFICKIKHIPIKRNTDLRYEYEFEGNIHYYRPDFIINDNEVVEIKGDQFKDKKNGWKYPARKNSNLTLEEIEKENEKYKLKYECAIKNNVKIIYTSEFDEYSKKFRKYLRKYKFEKTKKEKREELKNAK